MKKTRLKNKKRIILIIVSGICVSFIAVFLITDLVWSIIKNKRAVVAYHGKICYETRIGDSFYFAEITDDDLLNEINDRLNDP